MFGGRGTGRVIHSLWLILILHGQDLVFDEASAEHCPRSLMVKTAETTQERFIAEARKTLLTDNDGDSATTEEDELFETTR